MAGVALPSKALMPVASGSIEVPEHRSWGLVDDNPEMEPVSMDGRARLPLAKSCSPKTGSSPSSDPASPRSEGRQHGHRTMHNKAAMESNMAVSRRVENLRPSNIKATGRAASDEHCTCPQPTKVPRPCNSFILYRQSMSAQVTQENPGLSNPEISKIIGQRWKEESEEVQNHFRAEALEASRKHREAHPDYRYQPKRKGSTVVTKDSYTEEECPKCGGIRFVSTPVSATSALKRGMDDHLGSADEDRQYRASRDGARWREQYSADAFDSKRRRLAETADSRGMAAINTQHLPGYSAGAGGRYVHVDTPVPHQQSMMPPQHRQMPPPPRPYGGQPPKYALSEAAHQAAHASPQHPGPGTKQPGHVANPRDPTITLPPLRTALTPATSSAYDQLKFSHTQQTPSTAARARPHMGLPNGLELTDKTPREQIVGLPLHKKLVATTRISLPLPRPEEGRGAIIAVEGMAGAALRDVSHAVEKALIVCQETVVTSWSNDSEFAEQCAKGESIPMSNALATIFKDILTWHRKSDEMTRFVQGESIGDSPARATHGSRGNSPRTEQNKTKTPVALVKGGYSVTMSELFACATSHDKDAYSPVDHWQWMATLWRGIVGPDLIVYVRMCPKDELEKLKTVEFQKGQGVMMVRLPMDGQLDDATERRLNFEIIEWVTDVWPRTSPSEKSKE